MQKGLVIAVILAVVASTASVYFYDKYAQAETKYSLLRIQYLSLLEERGKYVEQHEILAEKLENCTKMLEKAVEESEDAERQVEELKDLISTNPERWTVRLVGSTEERLERARQVVEDSLNSPIVSKFAEMIVVSDAVYLNQKRFSFDYVEDEAMLKENDAIVNPEWFLIHRVGDCDDVAAAMAAVMKVKGYDVKFCVGQREGEESKNSKHAWVRIGDEDVDYRYCVNRVCEIEVGYFGNVAEKCIEV